MAWPVTRIFGWPWNLLFLGACMLPLLIRLGFWQLDRGDSKTQQLHIAQDRINLPALQLTDVQEQQDAFALQYRKLAGNGFQWRPQMLLLDNITRKGIAGVEVLQPIQLQKYTLLVNRGWLPWPDRSNLPSVPLPKALQVTGVLHRFPTTGIQLGDTQPIAAFPALVTNIDPDALAESLQTQFLYPLVLRLEDGHADAFTTDWQMQGGSPALRHYGYAIQWFAMALALLICMLVVLIWHRKKNVRTTSP